MPIHGFNNMIKKTRKQQQSCAEIVCRNWQNYNKCGLCVCKSVSFCSCVTIKCVYAWLHVCVCASLSHWWSHSLYLISICHFLTSQSGADDGQDDCLSSLQSTSRPLCAHDPISLKVQVKWRELDWRGRKSKRDWVGGRDKLRHPTITGN